MVDTFAKSSKLLHRGSNLEIETPLLIPSFSSKGFKFSAACPKLNSKYTFTKKIKKSKKLNPTSGMKSEVFDAMQMVSDVLTDCLLVSSYDIFHGHVGLPQELIKPDFIMLDSGGYETSECHDLSAVFRHTCPINEWNELFYNDIISLFADHVPTIIVSYDHGSTWEPIPEQIDNALEFFAKHPKHLHNLILKPENKADRTFKKETWDKILNNVKEFIKFDIVGFTEKELGNSVLSNMYNIAKVRRTMNENGIHTPIQNFGSLDPITCCLYFFAGAEIFDGLTWLRYGFSEGMAVYPRNFGALSLGIHEKDDLVLANTLRKNIYYLRELQLQMKEFLKYKDFLRFKNNAKFFEEAASRLNTKIGGKL